MTEQHWTIETAPIFIDFESSSLSLRSFPIEIAWGSKPDKISSYLISPYNIPSWTDWSTDSEKIHGITRDYLEKHGIAPKKLCQKIIHELANQHVFSENPDWDSMWLLKLFQACEELPPVVGIHDVNSLLLHKIAEKSTDILAAQANIVKMKIFARQVVQQKHRAEPDVRYLTRIWQMAMKFPETDYKK